MLLVLIPVAVVVPAFVALAFATAVGVLVVAYEAIRYGADLVRVRHPDLPT